MAGQTDTLIAAILEDIDAGRLAPGQEHRSEAHDAGVTEDVYVTEGPLEVLADGGWTRLEAGRALRFAADQPHGYRAPQGQGAEFLNTLHYPGRANTSVV